MVVEGQLLSVYRSVFLDVCRGNGEIAVVDSLPVVHPALPTLFMTSCGLSHTERYLLGEELERAECLVQECIRFPDRLGYGDSNHLCAFHMAGIFQESNSGIEPLIPVIKALFSAVGIPVESLWATVSFGGRIGGVRLPVDEHAEGALYRLGVESSRIYRLPNIWQPRAEASSGGRTVELFYETTTMPCSNTCIPGCSCGRFLELAIIVQTEVRRSAKPKRALLQAGVGLERLACAKELKVASLIDDMAGPALRLTQLLDIPLDRAVTATDRIRAILLALRDGGLPGGRGRGFILRKLVKELGLAVGGRLEVASSKFVSELWSANNSTMPSLAHLLRRVLSHEWKRLVAAG